jgi:hypothetical protein
MANTHPRNKVVLKVEALEIREVPSSTPLNPAPVVLTQSFDDTQVGRLPAGWAESSTGNGFIVSSVRALSGPHSLSTADPNDQSARAWLNTAVPADAQTSASIYLNSIVPALVFARGTGLATDSPSYYAVHIERGLYAQLLRVQNGVTSVLGSITSQGYVSGEWVKVTLSTTGSKLQVQIYRVATKQYLNNAGEWQSLPTWVLDRTDAALTGGGMAGVARSKGYNGSLSFDDFSVTYGPPGTGTGTGTGSGTISIPQHYPNIRIAELAYSGMTIGPVETELLKNSVDLVVSDIASLGDQIQAVAPNTPQLAYANVSSLYQNALLSWDNYADSHGVSREGSFLHASQPTSFTGDSPSSQPVSWFWGVYSGGDSPSFTDLTTAAHSRYQKISFGNAGNSVYIGYPEQFNEINFNLSFGAHDGWKAVLEYATAVDSNGNPTAWAALPTSKDTTFGLTWSGRVTFDPPANWKTALVGGAGRLYYVRVRTLQDGTAPIASTILGADYVNAHGTSSGVIPVFDYAADANRDGYLNDAEYAKAVAAGHTARFAYQSRVFFAYYGQERFATNPSFLPFQSWAVSFFTQYLKSLPKAGGLFMDNSGGNAFVNSTQVLENVANYSSAYGSLLAAIDKAIAPRWILANTSGGSGTTADGVVKQNPAYFEEFALRPLAQSWQQFEDLAATVAHRAGLQTPSPYAVLDVLPQGGSATDPRTQLATLAEYYMLGDPHTTFLDPFGGSAPATSWSQHWIPAAAYNIGHPTGEWSLFASGADGGNRALTYRVYQRSYSNALVLYRPLSYAQGASAPGLLSSTSATYFALQGTYRALNADGTLGPAVTGVTLRNGEGAIMVKA